MALPHLRPIALEDRKFNRYPASNLALAAHRQSGVATGISAAPRKTGRHGQTQSPRAASEAFGYHAIR